MSTTSMWKADNQAFSWAQRKKDGKRVACVHGLGPTDDVRCARLCRDGNPVCYRSGSACSIGALAMTRVPQ